MGFEIDYSEQMSKGAATVMAEFVQSMWSGAVGAEAGAKTGKAAERPKDGRAEEHNGDRIESKSQITDKEVEHWAKLLKQIKSLSDEHYKVALREIADRLSEIPEGQRKSVCEKLNNKIRGQGFANMVAYDNNTDKLVVVRQNGSPVVCSVDTIQLIKKRAEADRR